MKRIFLFIAILCSVVASAQKPTNYLYQPTRSRVINNMADSGTTTVPLDRPRIPGGTSAQAGLMVVDTVGGGKGFWFLMDGTFHHLVDSSALADTSTAIRAIVGSGGSLSGGNRGSAFRLYDVVNAGVKTLNLTSPLAGDSVTTGQINVSIPAATSSVNGYLTSTDWSTFNSKQSALTFTKSVNNSSGTVSLLNDVTDAGPSAVYGQQGATKGFFHVPLLDTTNRDHSDTTVAVWVTAAGKMVFVDKTDFGSAGSGAAPGSDTYQVFNRSNVLTAVDSFKNTTNGIDIKGDYLKAGAWVIYKPDQTNFLNSIFYGSKPASISHSSGIQGQYNTGLGLLALNALTSGASNVAIGSRAGQALTTATNCALLGDGAGIAITTGGNNTGIGMGALQTNSTATGNTAVGFESLKAATGNNNIGIGSQAVHENTSATDNVGIGFQAIYQNTTGLKNTAVGSNAGTGTASNAFADNAFFGYKSGFGITTASDNTAIGYLTAPNLTTGGHNVFVGDNAGGGVTTGSHVNAFGDNLGSFAAAESGVWVAGSNALRRIWINSSGRVKIGSSITNTDTAANGWIHIMPGNTQTPPFVLSNGTVTSTGVSGAIEYDNTNFYGTNTSTNRGIIQRSIINVSNGASATLGAGTNYYVFSGTTTTWTLPSISGLVVGTEFNIKNRGSGSITLNSSAGGNDIYTTSAVSTATITAGSTLKLVFDGTFFITF